MALFVGDHDAVFLAREQHGEVFDVDDGVQSGLRLGRPVVEGEPVLHDRAIALAAAVRERAVDHQVSHGDDAGGHRVGQPVHDVDVVRCLLQEEARRAASIRVPVLEVVVAPVADEVAAPDRFHLADAALLDDAAQRAHHVHVAHVVADVQGRARAVRGLQDAVGSFDRDGDRLFEEDRNPGLEQGAGDVLVGVVGAGDDGRVDRQAEELVERGHPLPLPECARGTLPHGGVGVAASDEEGWMGNGGEVVCD